MPRAAPGLIKFVKEGESAVNNPGLVQLRVECVLSVESLAEF
jgi:hypothetical protein